MTFSRSDVIELLNTNVWKSAKMSHTLILLLKIVLGGLYFWNDLNAKVIHGRTLIILKWDFLQFWKTVIYFEKYHGKALEHLWCTSLNILHSNVSVVWLVPELQHFVTALQAKANAKALRSIPLTVVLIWVAAAQQLPKTMLKIRF